MISLASSWDWNANDFFYEKQSPVALAVAPYYKGPERMTKILLAKFRIKSLFNVIKVPS